MISKLWIPLEKLKVLFDFKIYFEVEREMQFFFIQYVMA